MHRREVAEEYVWPITALPINPATLPRTAGATIDHRGVPSRNSSRGSRSRRRKSPVTNETMGKRLFPAVAVQVRNSLKRLVESGAIFSGSKADAWKKAMKEEAEVAAVRLKAEGGDATSMSTLGFSYRDGVRGLKTRSSDLARLSQSDGAVAQAGRVVAVRRASDDMLGSRLLPWARLGRGARHRELGAVALPMCTQRAALAELLVLVGAQTRKGKLAGQSLRVRFSSFN